ncbi:MAG: hypothetical protein FVQ78_01165 [Solirubrobacterales bacterium]|nr:hypothetical protein [Solirubrobacterales bacterium]
MWRSGGGAWRRRLRRAPSLSAMTDEELQRVILDVILREYPVLLTFPAIACELFENPDDLLGGMALARAVRDLVMAGLLRSNGFLVLPSRSALHVKRLSGRDGWSAWG